MIESYLIEALIAFAEKGTLSSAAEYLQISQPALSRSMKKLEDTLGVPLFVRTKNSITLNENGELFLKYAKQIEQLHDQAIQKVQDNHKAHQTIHVGMSIPAPEYLYKPVLEKLYPQSEITFTLIEDEEELIKAYDNQTYDLLFLHHKVSHKDSICKQIFTETLGIAVLPAHPIASFTEGISFAQIDGLTILQQTKVGYWNAVVKNHLPNCHIIYQTNRNDLDELIKNSTLPTFVTSITTPYHFNLENRLSIPIIDDDAKLPIYVMMHKSDISAYETLLK